MTPFPIFHKWSERVKFRVLNEVAGGNADFSISLHLIRGLEGGLSVQWRRFSFISRERGSRSRGSNEAMREAQFDSKWPSISRSMEPLRTPRTNNVHKILVSYLLNFPSWPHLGLISGVKSTQPPLLRPPQCIRTSSVNGPWPHLHIVTRVCLKI